MLKLIIAISLLFVSVLMAQNNFHTIHFTVTSNSIPDSGHIYISGNHQKLGDWIPDVVKLEYQGNRRWIKTLTFAEGTKLEFKFTRGSWETEALNSDGTIPQNHTITVNSDTSLTFAINQWKSNQNRKSPDKSTITGVVKYHRNMENPGIKSRDLIVWLPPGYEVVTNQKYPVLYMHDGQNVFDASTAFLGIDWQVDETADSLIRNNIIEPLIVVGIYNTEDRRTEYAPTDLGQIYMRFIVEKLKPFIDQNYRTLPGRENTVIGGSSMGGLISFMLAWEYPGIFSKAICMSPAFKIRQVDYVSKVVKDEKPEESLQFYFDNGGVDLEAELQPGIDDMLKVLNKKGYQKNIDYFWFKDDKAPHNESAWAQRIWMPLKYFFKK